MCLVSVSLHNATGAAVRLFGARRFHRCVFRGGLWYAYF